MTAFTKTSNPKGFAKSEWTGLQVGDADPFPGSSRAFSESCPCRGFDDLFKCARTVDHRGDHVATDGVEVVEVWERQ